MAVNISKEGLELIKRWEQLRLKPYDDGAGFQTIGWGHKIRKEEDFGEEISVETANALLVGDVLDAEKAVHGAAQVPLRQNEYDALVSLAYNIGAGNFARSTLVQKLNEKDYLAAARHILDWVFIKGKPSLGLFRRRLAEAARFVGP